MPNHALTVEGLPPFTPCPEPDGVAVLVAWSDAAQSRSHQSQQRAALASVRILDAIARSDAWFEHYREPREPQP